MLTGRSVSTFPISPISFRCSVTNFSARPYILFVKGRNSRAERNHRVPRRNGMLVIARNRREEEKNPSITAILWSRKKLRELFSQENYFLQLPGALNTIVSHTSERLVLEYKGAEDRRPRRYWNSSDEALTGHWSRDHRSWWPHLSASWIPWTVPSLRSQVFAHRDDKHVVLDVIGSTFLTLRPVFQMRLDRSFVKDG